MLSVIKKEKAMKKIVFAWIFVLGLTTSATCDSALALDDASRTANTQLTQDEYQFLGDIGNKLQLEIHKNSGLWSDGVRQNYYHNFMALSRILSKLRKPEIKITVSPENITVSELLYLLIHVYNKQSVYEGVNNFKAHFKALFDKMLYTFFIPQDINPGMSLEDGDFVYGDADKDKMMKSCLQLFTPAFIANWSEKPLTSFQYPDAEISNKFVEEFNRFISMISARLGNVLPIFKLYSYSDVPEDVKFTLVKDKDANKINFNWTGYISEKTIQTLGKKYRVVLKSLNPETLIQTTKIVRNITNWGLRETKERLQAESLPLVLVRGLSNDEATAQIQKFYDLGVEIEAVDESVPVEGDDKEKATKSYKLSIIPPLPNPPDRIALKVFLSIKNIPDAHKILDELNQLPLTIKESYPSIDDATQDMTELRDMGFTTKVENSDAEMAEKDFFIMRPEEKS